MMKKILFVTILAGIMIVIPCCFQADDEPLECGDRIIKNINWDSYDLNPWTDYSFYTYTEDNARVFVVSRTVENVCPEKHIKLSVVGQLNLPCPRNVEIRVDYHYSVFSGTVFADKTFQSAWIYYSTPAREFGIKQAFNGIPGSFYMDYEWVIDDYLDYEVDLDYFKSIFKDAELIYEYYLF